jgi:phosphate transport system substrate-binding protein
LAAVLSTAGSAIAASAASATAISGAGSTFVAPIMAEWANDYSSSSGNAVTYSAVGSGTGMTDLSSGQVQFGASDAPLSAYPQLTNLQSGYVQFPEALGAVAIAYNLPGVKVLKLTGPVIAEIFLGQITTWNNPAIKALNKGVNLPSTTITPIFRSDGSGTSYAFTDYLSKISSAFASKVGKGTQPTFPSPPDVGGKGSLGQLSVLQNTPGGIAYMDTAYLIAHNVPAAAVENNAHRFVYPNLPEIKAAASVVKSLPPNNQVDITNPPKKVKNGYPISTFTYLMAPTNSPIGSTLQGFFNYIVGPSGQGLGPALDYVPLPSFIVKADKQTISKIQ